MPRKIDWLDYAHQLHKEREAIQDRAGPGLIVSVSLSDFGSGYARFHVHLTHLDAQLEGSGCDTTPTKALERAKKDLAAKLAERDRQPRLVAAAPKALPAARPAATLFGGD